jgi:hypothetical protein
VNTPEDRRVGQTGADEAHGRDGLYEIRVRLMRVLSRQIIQCADNRHREAQKLEFDACVEVETGRNAQLPSL